jgi:hypothetical protein
MIYTVECSFADPASEKEWNRFYSMDKLPALISVQGFRSSQRFRALTPGCPTYLAAHAIDSLDVLTGEEYQRKGGGNFARWQQHITDWHRNLYAGLTLMPEVGEEELLLLTTAGPDLLQQLGAAPCIIEAVALAKNPPLRWLATIARAHMPDLARLPAAVHAYAPMTPRLTPNPAPKG